MSFKILLSMKRLALKLFLPAIMASLLLPSAVFADANKEIATCTVNGQPGVYVSIAVNGQNCIPISGNTLQTNPIFIYTVAILKVMSGLVGVATVGGFLWGGILYITARASASQVEKAKTVIINATIGLLMFIFMFAILQYLIPGGIFTGAIGLGGILK